MKKEHEDETPTQRKVRHRMHQHMLWWHRTRKSLARERHRDRWHKTTIIPIQLV